MTNAHRGGEGIYLNNNAINTVVLRIYINISKGVTLLSVTWMSEGFKHCVNAIVTVFLVPHIMREATESFPWELSRVHMTTRDVGKY